jgi:hypothetical protein
MTAGNEHLETLRAARMRTVEGRREVGVGLTGDYEAGHTEDLRRLFVELQSTVEAIDRAILDEERLAQGTDVQIPPG